MTKRILIFAIGLIGPLFATAEKTKVDITFSAQQEGNEAHKAFDQDPTSRWSAQGKGQWVQIEWPKAIELDQVGLGFISGTRIYAVELKASTDGKNWTPLNSFNSSGKGDGLETFSFKKTSLKFLRLISQGNNQNDWMNLHTFHIAGITPDIKKPNLASGESGLTVSEFSPVGMMGSVVGISLDNQGRVYATHTYRRNNGALDIRRNFRWLHESLASRSVEDKRKLIRKNKKDWESLFKWKEKNPAPGRHRRRWHGRRTSRHLRRAEHRSPRIGRRRVMARGLGVRHLHPRLLSAGRQRRRRPI